MKNLIGIILIFSSINILANDAYLGSIGGNVFPVFNKDSIRMLKEDINLQMERDSCFVTCKFWFVNNTNKNVGLLMGFPDYISDPANASQSLKSFTCNVNGVAQIVDKFTSRIMVETDSNTEWYEKWYCWYVDFGPFDTIEIENTYWGYYGGSIGGTYSIDYLIGTAKTWNGTIGEGKVVFNYSSIISSLFIDTSYYRSDEFLPYGLSRIIDKDSIIFHFTNYSPEWDQRLGVSFYPYWQTTLIDIDQKYLKETADIIRTKEQYRLMRNEIYARHGYLFKDKQFQEYFDKQVWYKRDLDFDLNQLNKDELFFIDLLKSLEESVK
jgi:hypothetical protein